VAENLQTVIGVRFHPIGKLYHFDASAHPEIRPGDRVIVETARGRQLGEAVAFIPQEKQQPGEGGHKAIERMATPQDLVMQQMWQSRETEAMIECRARAAELRLLVKVVKADYNYDGSRLTLLYATEGDDKANTGSLRGDMQRLFPKTHVELRQIGPRDVAKILCGLGACGLETRCCSMFLTEFSPVSIKMAKEQGISLNPQEITGMCGRLRCCLVYEYEQYVAARKNLPRRGKRVGTPRGEGKVLDINPLKQTVYV
jgi:cell fate regulator YaaT (PSP1 superfamily)